MEAGHGQHSAKDNYQENAGKAVIEYLDRTIALAGRVRNGTAKEDVSDKVERQSAQQNSDVTEVAANEPPKEMLIRMSCKVSIFEYDKEHTEWEDMAELSDQERLLKEFEKQKKARDMEWKISAVKKVDNKHHAQNGDNKKAVKTAEPVKEVVKRPTGKNYAATKTDQGKNEVKNINRFSTLGGDVEA